MEFLENLIIDWTIENVFPAVSVGAEAVGTTLGAIIPEPVTDALSNFLTTIAPVWNLLMSEIYEIMEFVYF